MNCYPNLYMHPVKTKNHVQLQEHFSQFISAVLQLSAMFDRCFNHGCPRLFSISLFPKL